MGAIENRRISKSKSRNGVCPTTPPLCSDLRYYLQFDLDIIKASIMATNHGYTYTTGGETTILHRRLIGAGAYSTVHEVYTPTMYSHDVLSLIEAV